MIQAMKQAEEKKNANPPDIRSDAENRRRRMESRAPGGTQSTSNTRDEEKITMTGEGKGDGAVIPRDDGGEGQGMGGEGEEGRRERVLEEGGEEANEDGSESVSSEELTKEEIQKKIQKKEKSKRVKGKKGKGKRVDSSEDSGGEEGWLRNVKDYGMLVEKDNCLKELRTDKKKERRGIPDGRPLLDRLAEVIEFGDDVDFAELKEEMKMKRKEEELAKKEVKEGGEKGSKSGLRRRKSRRGRGGRSSSSESESTALSSSDEGKGESRKGKGKERCKRSKRED
ncbi:uncharacterized protein MELLADRAFT_62463 [Melampsora larici-populina 98AG31]|uniref:Uncharacterized protein n=1 Tax=Melampsora larici-populina (strain 98AG31 / pathotype 3-4-7) TaxID=747676 RepID=F4RJ22_MELLP|nr:uncharacterized protein MELLADRAFT_62463 [Melampsora larici-populina 98AG31]EGG07728.1 hypothetical protein MELLADRAFT_62463 [Melampsora larici-populina 98AG31]